MAKGVGLSMRRTFKLGRFAVYDMLGRGGSGVVLRASHLSTNIDVAIKVLSHQPDPQRLRDFHREVQAQARLAHPAIVYLFEYGQVSQKAAAASDGLVAAGAPYVAMELAEHATLRQALPLEDWPSLRAILLQILDALAFSHARGVIHRDLKPENLLVFDDAGGQRIKLADFGIAHASADLEQPRDAELSQFSGTPQYAAPEQIRGQWRQFGPWTDLYSLGCVVWELICGRPPYSAGNSLKTLMLQLDEPAPPLSPGFPVPMDMRDWVRRAMSKDPASRFRSAAQAAYALPPASPQSDEMLEVVEASSLQERERNQQTGVSTEWLPAVTTVLAYGGAASRDDSTSASRGRPSTPQRPEIPSTWRRERRELPTPLVGTGLELFGLRSVPFVGRSTERDVIWRQLADVVEGRGRRAVLVSGESGAGKSRLVEWMAERADELGVAEPIVVRHASAARDPSSGLAAAIRHWAKGWRLDRSSFFYRLSERLEALTGDDSVSRELARALTEYVHPTDDDDDDVEGPRFQFANPRQRRATVARFFELVASRAPLVVVLDDLQWSSEALGLFDHLLTDDAASNMLLLGTIRTDARTAIDQLGQRVDELGEHTACESVTLQPLASSAHRELIELRLPLEANALDAIVERTEGNPLFAIHLLDALVESGSLEMCEDGFVFDDASARTLPDDIHGLWQDRIDRLAGEYDAAGDVRAGIELAAALGRDVDDDEWRVALEIAGIVVPDGLVDHIIERGLARRGAQSWSFTHGMLVDSLARQAREADRWQGFNDVCARALRILGGRNQGHRRIAEHLVEAGRPEDALAPLMAAYEGALTAARPDQGREHIERRAELLDQLGVDAKDRRCLENSLALGRIATLTADWEDAQTVFDEVLPESRRRGFDDIVVQALHVAGIYHWRHGELDQARRILEEGLELDEDVRGQNTLRLLLSLGWVEVSSGNLEKAREHFRETTELARTRGNIDRVLVGMRAIAVVADHLGDRKAALEQLEEVLERSDERGYLLLFVSTHNALGDLYRYEGDFERAYAHTEAYARISDQMGVNISSRIALSNQAQVCLGMGRLDEAEEYIEQLERDFADRGVDSSTDVYIDVLRLTLAAARGRWDELGERVEPYVDGWQHPNEAERDHRWMLARAVEFAREGGPPELVARLEAVARRVGDVDG